MESDLVAPATPTEVIPPPEPPAPEPSIADHEAQFGKGAKDATPPAGEPAPPRHRAKSQQAKAEDVPRIAELTRRLRETERERDEWKGKATPAPVAPTPAAEPTRTVTPSAPATSGDTFPDAEPTLEQFMDQPDPYSAWQRALGRYDRKKEAWDAEQVTKQSQATAAKQAEEHKWQADITAHQTRVQSFASAHPDFGTVTQELMQQNLPSVLLTAIVRSDNSPELIYHLAQHPDDLDELYLLSDGKTASDASVAILQRRLLKLYGSAAPTGSVPVAAANIPPRPPNPVRTGPLKPSDALPGDDASIAEHEKVWGKRRRR